MFRTVYKLIGGVVLEAIWLFIEAFELIRALFLDAIDLVFGRRY